MATAVPVARLALAGVPDPSYGLAGLKLRLEGFLRRCELDGGQPVPSTLAPTRFVSGDGTVKQALLPTVLTCRRGAGYAWGITLTYLKPTLIVGSITGDASYVVTVSIAFQSAATIASWARASGTVQSYGQQNEVCAAKRAAYSDRLHKDPRIGMEVGFGLIVDLRPPLALIQYDALGRQLKGKDQEWIPIASLGPGSDCPS